MAMEMNRLSLNSDGAFRTTMQSRIPQTRNTTSTETEKCYLIGFNYCRKTEICDSWCAFPEWIIGMGFVLGLVL